MSNTAKNAEYSSDDEEEEESDSEEAEQPKNLKGGKVDAKILERNQQEEEEESSEEEDDSETDNDAQRYNTVRREGGPVGALKAGISNHPAGKRGREGEGKDEEPASKKSRDLRVDRGRTAAKPASPTRPTKGEPVGKISKAAAAALAAAKAKQEKVRKLEEAAKASAAGRKRKAPSPPANGAAKQQPQKLDSPLKAKSHFTWTNDLEITLCSLLYQGKIKGKPVPGTKGDPYWTKLVKDLSSDGTSLTETQLSEKVRRMRNRYNALKARDVDSPWRNPHEEKLYRFWDGIWGSAKYVVRPQSTQAVPDDGDEEEESSEEEEDEVATPAVKATIVPPPASRKEESSESEEESDDEEEPQVALKKEVAGLAGPSTEAELSAFIPKPRLEYTPLLQKDEKKVRRGDDGSIAEQSGAELSADENDREGLPPTSSVMSDLMRSLRKESFALLQEVRAGCMDAVNVLRKQGLDDLRGGNFRLGANGPASGMWKVDGSSLLSLDRGILDDLTSRATANAPDSAVAGELKRDWRELRVEEMDLLEKRIQLALKQLQHARKEFEEQDI
ncbi:protein MpGEBP1 [Marchantia polymorpha subsp. ruderalis]|nr:hypothetical protein MARPO_0002s0271 [Marchantia polymorpha]BBN00061.1 hypothetical protein Mp_1g26050 [Marchantia polymorpha subsp. ruderalis]|eukprot:PTQ49822.1 hypothetical protein MARPO_0002s0271 [Marchantia polymorpha]